MNDYFLFINRRREVENKRRAVLKSKLQKARATAEQEQSVRWLSSYAKQRRAVCHIRYQNKAVN